MESKLESYTRAERLLFEHLNKKQKLQYKRNLQIVVVKGPRRYFINSNRVTLKQDKRQSKQACLIFPKDDLPDADRILAKKLLIEGAEELFIKTANWE